MSIQKIIGSAAIFAAPVVVCCLFDALLEQHRRQARREKLDWMAELYCSMAHKLQSLVKEGITRQEWEGWLPIVEILDEDIRRYTHLRPARLADLVILMIEVTA